MVRWHIENDGSLIAEGLSVTGTGTVNAVDFFDNGVNINTIYAPLAAPTFTSIVTISSASPELRFGESDAVTQERNWRISAAAGDFYLQALSDDYSGATNPIIITRTGTTIDAIQLVATALTWGGNTVWSSGNDGAGSGLDADLLDGFNSSYFVAASGYVASDVLGKLLTVDGAGSGLDADLWDGNQFATYLNQALLTTSTPTFGGLTLTSATGFLPQINITNTNDDANAGYVVLRKSPADTLVSASDYIGTILWYGRGSSTTEGTAATIYARAEGTRGTNWVATNLVLSPMQTSGSYKNLSLNADGTFTWGGNTVWHAGNDGASSGLDADTVDSYHVGTSGGAIPLMNGANTWSGLNIFNAADTTTDRIRITNSADSQRLHLLAAQVQSQNGTLKLNASDGNPIHLQSQGVTYWNFDENGFNTGLSITSRADGTSGGAFINFLVAAGTTNFILGTYSSIVGGTYDKDPTIYSATGSSSIFWYNGGKNAFWHAANDGAGSGLDADLLDGNNIGSSGTAIPLLSAANNWGGAQTFAGGAVVSPNATVGLTLQRSDDGASGAMMDFAHYSTTPAANDSPMTIRVIARDAALNTTVYGRLRFFITNATDTAEAGYWQLAPTTAGVETAGLTVTGTTTTFNANTVWHAGNDGAGSGLDADTLDGNNVGTAGAAIPLLSATNTWAGNQTFQNATTVYTKVESTATNSQTGLQIITRNAGGVAQNSYFYVAAAGDPSLQAASGAFGAIWFVGNDGAGSGLDADLWDGNNFASYLNQAVLTTSQPSFNSVIFTSTDPYLRVDNNTKHLVLSGGTGWTSTSSTIVLRSVGAGTNAGGLEFYPGETGGKNFTIGAFSSFQFNGNNIWHAGNDSSGSGLDADTVDGYQAANLGRLAVAQSWTAQQTFDYDGTTIFNDPTGDYVLQFNTAGTARGYIGADATYSFSVRNTGGTRLLSAVNSTGAVEAYSLDATNGSVRILPATTGLQHFDGAGNYRWIEGVRSDITGNVNDWTLFNSSGGETIRAYHSTRVVNFPVNITIGANTNWHAANDGAGSGLDADLFDGLNSTVFVYGVNGSGSTVANLTQTFTELAQYKSGFWDVNAAAWTPDTGYWWGLTMAHTSNGPAYNYGGQFVIQNSSGTPTAYLRSISGGATPAATAWQKIWTAAVDGAGSGLDADLLDGVQLAEIPSGNNGLGITTTTSSMNSFSKAGWYTYLSPTGSPTADWWTWMNIPGHTGVGDIYGYQLAVSYWGDDMRLRRSMTNVWQSWVQVWNSGVDGSGSGLDADLWDGNQFATYLNQAVLTSSSPSFVDVTITSDERLKSDIVPIQGALTKVLQLRGAEYTRRATGKREIGVIAQDLEAAGLELLVDRTESNLRTVKYMRLSAVLIEAVKELSAKIDRLERAA